MHYDRSLGTGRARGLQCAKNYAFEAQWNGVFYTTKRVQPIFAEEPDELVVVTVYSYYF